MPQKSKRKYVNETLFLIWLVTFWEDDRPVGIKQVCAPLNNVLKPPCLQHKAL